MTRKEDTLRTYRAKRNFEITPEPDGPAVDRQSALRFVVQKHWASRLHYDLRLEIDGVMKSWAVPKGPSLDPHDKRMAVQVEDHPVAYNDFEGEIPSHQYGAGTVIVWDCGTWTPAGDPAHGWQAGKLKFSLQGHKLKGHWTLVRMRDRAAKQPAWLLMKEADRFARSRDTFDVVEQLPDSVKSTTPAVDSSAPDPQKSKPSLARVRASPAEKPGEKKPARLSKIALPKVLSPPLATLVDEPPPDRDQWLYELKFDGYRLLARIDGQRIQLVTRNGNDWTAKMPALAEAVARLGVRSGWLDGEILVMDDHGVPNFQALQNGFEIHGTGRIVYYLFDVPFFEGHDLRGHALIERRKLLQQLLQSQPSDLIRFSDSFDAAAGDLVASACKIGFEGVIGKRIDSPYVSGRAGHWIKLKCGHRQEFVVGGYTDPQGTRTGIGALLLGVHEGGQLRYAGKVGTGFNEETLSALEKRFGRLASADCPFSNPRDIALRAARWLQPTLVAEVSFAGWTRTGRVRHAVFHGLRTDKPAADIVRETPASPEDIALSTPAGAASAPPRASRARAKPAAAQNHNGGRAAKTPAPLQLTHADRVVDPSTGATKKDVARHYATVAPHLMDHLRQRPVSIVRAPRGIGGELFFQKHAEGREIVGIESLDPALDPGHAPLLAVADPQGLLGAAQMNVIEFHTWNATRDRIERPDRMAFDIDPGEGVGWEKVQEAAQLVRALLQELELPAFLKTSGGKGLHVVVPIKRLYGWDTVRNFSEAIVQHLSRTLPRRFVAKSGPRNRVGKIFVDYLRNGRGATTVAAWSLRARPGLGVSVPVVWDELPALRGGGHWNIQSVVDRVDTGNTPWKDYATSAAALTPAMRALDFI